MNILTWNIRHGGGNRINSIIEVLKNNHKCQLLIISEYRNNKNGIVLRNKLKQQGYIYQTPNVIDRQKVNSVFIAGKQAFNYNLFDELKEHKQRVIQIEINKLIIYGCYFPQKNLKKIIFDFLLKKISGNQEKKIIITGDINTGKHFQDEKGASFYCSDYLDKLEQKGMVDAWRLINKKNKEYSWYSNAGNGFRIDHFFISKTLEESVISCSYNHLPRENKVSDHSLMELQIMKVSDD